MALSGQGTQSEARVAADRSPPPEGTRTRPVVRLKAGQPLQVRWFVKNAGSALLHDLVVHFFVAREERAGQKTVPDPRRGTVAENAFAIELAPGASTHGSLQLPISEAGFYLVRIESLNSEHDHEHSAAIDVEVD